MKVHDCGIVALFAVSGPDAVRYLNGQMTQDVRKVIDSGISVPGCLLDIKGRVQFRVWVMENDDGGLFVIGDSTRAEELEARLGKYLIADDAEIVSLGVRRLFHGEGEVQMKDAICGTSTRFAVPGTDWLVPLGRDISFAEDFLLMSAEETEDLRIRAGIPAAAKELSEPVFPQEAGLEDSDVSFHKGCYTGQEVISRIKRAGKVNKQLRRLELPASGFAEGDDLTDHDGKVVGKITSISPLVCAGKRAALAFLKRGAEVSFRVV